LKDWTLVLIFGGWGAGICFALYAPAWIKDAHLHRQNRLIGRCRALYILGVNSIEADDYATARNLLAVIRRIESRWRFGNSAPYRIALAAYAIWVGFAGNLVIRWLALFFGGQVYGETLQEQIGRLADFALLAALGASGALWALGSYIGHWRSDWLVDDCGNRLERILNAERAVVLTPKSKSRRRPLDGLSALEIFGLRAVFSMRELDNARRLLAVKFHPDKWHNASASQRKAADEAMKRINSAYEELKTARARRKI